MNPIVTARNVALLLPFLSTNEGYPFLQGLRIEPHKDGGCLLIATDGHAMGIYWDKEAKADAPLTWMPSQTLLTVCGHYKDRMDEWDDVLVAAPEDGALLELTSPTWGKAFEFEGTDPYPPWRKTLPQNFTPSGHPFSPVITSKFARVATRLGSLTMTNFAAANLKDKKQPGPACIFPQATLPFFGMIMAQKTTPETTLSTLPDWLTP